MLTIGKVAKQAQITADSIRYYEREGLIRPATKSESGYRLYTDEAIRRIEFIKHAQQCGFSLAEIRELLELRSTDKACCDDIYRVSVEKKLQLEHKIKALNAMSHALSRLIDMCSHDRKSLDECPILGALEAGVAKQNGKARKARVKAGERSQ
ncbi:MAG TPA: heavy metal-responsive transcriptional regulator [Casimicrobiaceae bacterium]|jgi:MerR family Zn(II)-responsive transcriptional regulator of zntA|nr:heavy metal-responsive transcriptional regulator [Casimicrobiaceae bacterium]